LEPRDTAESDHVYDEWLVVRCQLGEREAFDALIARWHPRVWRYAVGMTSDPDAAGDVVQEVWLRVVRGIARLREASRFRPWLFGIARRVLMDRLRIRYAEPPMEPLDSHEHELEGSPADEGRVEDLWRLQPGLERLPATEREVLVLFYLQELSLNDIAAIQAIPVGTVKSRLFRGRRLLRRELERGTST
jgi:RNA polymerase sigma-70 factor (ECF subfamily)